ncbi:MAG TPA: hypothetical protein VKI61_12895 [Chitinophagaceae bacterium]|jgi:hypothetical protein|nr:hypothetical protein [Chitinophagaceae bacterium]
MKPNYTAADLRLDILALEVKSVQQEEDIKNTFSAAVNSLKPANLIKSTFSNAVKSPNLGKNLLNGAVSLAAGLLSKKILVRGSSNIFKKVLGTVVELGVAKVVSGNADKITSSGIKMINRAIK